MRLENSGLAGSWKILFFFSSVSSRTGLTQKTERLQYL